MAKESVDSAQFPNAIYLQQKEIWKEKLAVKGLSFSKKWKPVAEIPIESCNQ